MSWVKDKMKYSICMTNYNTEDVLERSLDSIISKINSHDFEIVVVDAKSKDNSLQILKNYAQNYGNMKIISKKCLRGMGRQIAFKNAKGNIIITADSDTIYNDNWIQLIRTYEQNNFNFALSAWFTQIYPRDLLEQVGGWNNLQYWEDVEGWSRVAKIGKYKTYPIVCGENLKRVVSTNFFEKTYRRYRKVHDKVLIAKHIPMYLWILTYWKIYMQNGGLVGGIGRFGYQSAILFSAVIATRLRRVFNEYGDMKYLSDLEKTVIDLGISDMQIEKDEYDTKEGCINAYYKGDYSYIP